MPILASKKFCTGCLACVESCKHNAIKPITKNGLKYISIDTTNCVNCGLCEKVCPIITPVKRNSTSNMIVYGGWCKIEKYRINAASGGAFTALALSFFKKFSKAIVVGSTLKENKAKHILIENSSDIELLMNSKYIQSDVSNIYSSIKQKLHEGYTVLFSGTPCQIAGLYGFLRKEKTLENLYTAEIICHGIPSDEALQLHLQYHHANHILSFRDKKNGWNNSQNTTIEIKGNPYKVPKKQDIFYKIFSGCLLDRRSCSNCIYSSINRVADITLADFWGKSFDKEDSKKGVSLIIANNPHGNKLIQESPDLYTFNSKLIDAINGQPRLYDGFKYIQYHPVALFPNFFNLILPPKLRLAILTNQMPWKLLWGGYRLMSIIHNKVMKKNILKDIPK